REVYGATAHFDGGPGEEPRRFHLGADIWAAAGTPVMAPISGLVHSFGFNNNLGDYGATIILSHSLNGVAFYTLYGHLSLDSLSQLREGQYVVGGSPFAWLGVPAENGGWPPHLHFQIIEHIGNYWADYPGVCRYSERNQYLTNCPNPELILQWMPYAMAH
ncbi:MAG TPA: peptidoglycan DD-metalloendopeptidase family protein, partial [Phnomibacter sp.]|nr:peptidoglycan DD-metalloendopeptidase family protein [Phnomibacter sp.]